MKRIIQLCSILIILLIYQPGLKAQQIMFDQGVRAGELQAFPVLSNPNQYYYLPDKIQVAKHPDGKPQFSFIRYVRNVMAEPGTSGITESGQAGGILHVLVNLDVSEEIFKNAEGELKRVNPNARLMGPVLYKSGRIAVISSIVGDDGGMAKKVVGLGSAPILEGQKAAVSVLLSKEGADILWATFQTPTPDLSFQFEMEASGYLSPKNVKIEADFEQIYSHKSFEAAAVTPVMAAEIKAAFDDLSNKGAIKVTQVGEDADLNKMKETAYNQLVNLIFDKVGGEGMAAFQRLLPTQRKSMLDRATEMLNKARTEARTENQRIEQRETAQRQAEERARTTTRTRMDSIYRARGITYAPVASGRGNTAGKGANRVAIPSFAITASFVMKKTKHTGKYYVDLNKYTEDKRTFPFSENVGNMLATCESCFFNVNLDDPLYKQRELFVNLVDVNNEDFGSYINTVEVIMRKDHENQEQTLQNLVVDKTKFNKAGNDFRMMYGWKGDNDRNAWLNYVYKTRWVFSGGFSVETDWQEEQFGSINLVPPLVKKTVYVEADPDFMTEKNIRAVEIKIFFENEGKEEIRTVNLQSKDGVLSKSVELILPKNVDDYEYEATWFIKGKPPMKAGRKPYNYGSLYLDIIPKT